MGTYKGEGEYNNFRELLMNSVWRESLAGKKFGEFTLFRNWAKEFGKLIDQLKSY